MPRYIVEHDPETKEFVASVDGFPIAVTPINVLAFQALATEMLADDAAEAPVAAPAASGSTS